MTTDADQANMFTDDKTSTTIVEKPNDQGVKTPSPQPDLNEVFADKLSAITNEDGEQKYTDVMTALEALKHTQNHVKTLEQENASFKQEQVKAQTMEEVLQQLKTTKTDQNVQTSSPEVDVETMRNVTFDTIRQYEQQKQETANQQSVEQSLIGKFGTSEKAGEAFGAKARDLGMDIKVLENLAATSPKAVLAYFSDIKEVTTKFVEGSVNTEAMSNQNPQVKPKKNIMYGASRSDILDAWRDAAPATEQ